MTQPSAATALENLRRALDAGAIDQVTFDAAAAGLLGARLTGPGAIAQGTGALAVGAGGVAVGGDNHAPINLGVLIQQATRPGASRQDLRRAYLARILRQADQLPLFAGDSAGAQVRLSAVYTALLTQLREPWPADGCTERLADPAEREPKHLSALDVLNAERQLVLLGGPGSGKSTFVTIVALSLAGEALGLAGPNLATLNGAGGSRKRRQRRA